MINNDFEIKNGCLIKYHGSSTDVVIPKSVTSIGMDAFNGCKSLTNITIPESVTSIEYRGFYGCKSLTTITIPESVTSIGRNVFSHCTSLTTITIPKSVTSIGGSAFSYCTSLTTITIPGNVTSIEDWTFYGCKRLTTITIPESVTSIGKNAFNECDSLITITIPENVTSIEDRAFNRCKSLTTITIPESVTSIGKSAFSHCTSLTTITIPESVTSIGRSAFSHCTSLTIITIPENVTSIEDGAFYGCSRLKAVTIPKGVTSIGQDAFNGCTSLTSITIPESVTSIEDRAFSYCENLTTVTILSNVIKIKEHAFPKNCKIILYNLYWKSDINFNKNFDLCNLEYLDLDGFKGQYDDTLVELAKRIFEKVKKLDKASILEMLKNFSNVNFFENLKLLKDMNMNDDKIINSFIICKNMMKNSIKENLIENYKYLLKLNILSKEDLSKLFFNMDFSNEKNVETLLTKILENNKYTIPRTVDALLLDLNDVNQLELRDRLTYIQVLCLIDGNNNEKIEQAQDMICKDMIETIEKRNRTLLGNINDGIYVDKIKDTGLMSISIPLHEKLNGLNPSWFDDLCNFIENNKDEFEQFLSVLNFNKDEVKCKYGKKKALNCLKNEIVGRILLSYILQILQKDKKIQSTDTFKIRHLVYNVSFHEIMNLAAKDSSELFANTDSKMLEKAINIMLMIDPYSFDCLRETAMQDKNEQIAYEKNYLFDEAERQRIKNEKNLDLVPNINHYIEHIANDISIPKLPNEDRSTYLKKVKDCFDLYIKQSDMNSLFSIGRAVDFYLRASHISLMQEEIEWAITSKKMYDNDMTEPENLKLYIMQETSRLGHSASEINYASSTKNPDRMFTSGDKDNKNKMIKEILKCYQTLNNFGLSNSVINTILSDGKMYMYNLLVSDNVNDNVSDLNRILVGLSFFIPNIPNNQLTKEDASKIKDLFKRLDQINKSNKNVLEQANLYLDEYTLFFDVKSKMAAETIGRIMAQLNPPTIDSFVSMSETDKKDFFANNGYIAEVRLDIKKEEKKEIVLVCYSKAFSTPFSIHLVGNPFNIEDSINRIQPIPTLSYYGIGNGCLTLRSSDYITEVETIINDPCFEQKKSAARFYKSSISEEEKKIINATNYALYDKYSLDKIKGR